ncbi:MAG: hypothetical protein E7080_02175 [Bacteroidales bacterium]|nr:hypothetical protein [Bacteroidales bacterium]
MNTNNNIESNSANSWNGVTLEELKFMRASSLIRLEMQKEYLKRKFTTTIPALSNNKANALSGITSKMTLIQKMFLFAKGVRLAVNVINYFRKTKK